MRPQRLRGKTLRHRLIAGALFVLLGAGPARAETLLTGFGGAAFGGVTDRTRGTYGGAIGFLGGGVFGFEIEGAATPEFFGHANDPVFTKSTW